MGLFLSLFTEVRGSGILRTSQARSSRKLREPLPGLDPTKARQATIKIL